MAVTAKVIVNAKTAFFTDTDGGNREINYVSLSIGPDYADGANAEWAKYTPTLSLSMNVLPSVAENFNVGDKFTLTFEKSTDG